MTRAGEMVECPQCKTWFRATKYQRKYCCEWCGQEAKRKRDKEVKRRKRAK